MSPQDVTRRGPTVTFTGSPEAIERFKTTLAAGLPKLMRTYERTGYGQMKPRDQRRYADWTPDRLLRHLSTVQRRPGNGGRPGRSAHRGPTATRSPGRQQDDPPPPPCACGCGKPSRQGSKYHSDAHGTAYRVRRHRAHAVTLPLPVDLAEQAWDAAGGDGFAALDAALAIIARLEVAA